jgi:spermidine/putrescine transport system substrate-binding protein
VVITWGDPKKAKLLGDAFKQETGISLRLIPGDNSSDFYNKIKAGGPGQYDVVISNVGFVPLYEKAGLVEVLNLDDFPAADELYPAFRTDMRFNYLKASNRSLAFPNQWGAYGMTYSTIDTFKPKQPISWEELWRAPKGKVMLSSYYVNDLAIAGRIDGLSWNEVFAMNGPALDKAKQRLRNLKPFLDPDSTEDQINDFVTKTVDVGLVFSLGFGTTVNRKAGSAVVKSVVPAEGVFGALDGQMLLKGASNRANALKWINFCGGKRAQMIFWDLYRGPTANRAATEAIIAKGGLDKEDMKAQQGDRPDIAAAMAQQRDPDHSEEWNKAWDEVLAG